MCITMSLTYISISARALTSKTEPCKCAFWSDLWPKPHAHTSTKFYVMGRAPTKLQQQSHYSGVRDHQINKEANCLVSFCLHHYQQSVFVFNLHLENDNIGKVSKDKKQKKALVMRPILSGVARTSRMLGHSKGMLHLYKLLRRVQKHLGSLGHTPPENL